MEETPVVTVFLRNGAEVLLLRRSGAVGSYTGRWGAVAGRAEGDPDGGARQEIREETGIDPDDATTVVRRGEPFPVVDRDLDTRWIVHPYLFECATRTVEPNEETTSFEWVPPTAVLHRETVPDLWTAYDHVRPRVETVANDREHGSAAISVRALAVLRDEAGMAATDYPAGRSWTALLDVARDLVAARPAMPVVSNRIDRAVSTAIDAGATPAALETAAIDEIERALAADAEAAGTAADRLRGSRIATLSRSGTVTATLERAAPEAVLVAESRPGGEGVDVASDLAERLDAAMTLTSDAALAAQLVAWDADALLVGADAIRPDGSLVNKVGTRGGALAAGNEGCTVAVVAASDKVEPARDPDGVGTERADATALDERGRAELTDDERVAVANPTFDVTPATAVDLVVTERGVLDRSGVEALAGAARERASWRR